MRKHIIIASAVIVGLAALVTAYSKRHQPDFSTAAASGVKESVNLSTILSEPNTAFFDIAIMQSGRVLATGLNNQDSKKLYLSEDGQQWSTKLLPADGKAMLGIKFSDENDGWIVGDGLVLKTEDGGKNWENLASPTNGPIRRVDFITREVGYIAGDFKRGCQIFRTVDGGRSWVKVYENPEGGTVFDLVALSGEVAIAAVNDSTLLRTEDGGQSWQLIGLETQGASGLSLTPEGRLWVIGRKGSFYYSADQGRTWHRPANFTLALTQQDWTSVAFADKERGIAVGLNAAIAMTRNGGMTWTVGRTNVSDNFNKIRLRGDVGMIIGTRKIYKLDGWIFNPSDQ